ncbi:restriction endonuclease subunit S [Bacillus inaquosorum]|uniref:restriction endonuclease subunit S n=1 Tax=Bacillus inaquosorum TaxID=483913 RepID=UPI00227E3CEE|nr:restriction endonuclease subunit S [Bacillus inaquosorum]MCY8236605.1 restriction endonuclease subunit S [Bacillus inaquosorum]
MTLNYKRIGDCIRLVDERNVNLKVTTLLGLSITKEFIPSVANTVGTDFRNYKIIRKNQFACSTMQVRRDKKMPVALLKDFDEAIISAAYPVFEVVDTDLILPEYLMIWFSRSEFDREACFYAIGGVRGNLEWEDFCNMKLPVPSINEQKKIVNKYKVLVDKINLNNHLIQKLEKTAQTIYKQWFVDFEFPNENGKPYKSYEGPMEFNEDLDKEIPQGWKVVPLKYVCTKIGSGATPRGGKNSYHNEGISLIRSQNVYDFVFSPEDIAFINENQANKLQNVKLEENDILLNITGVSVARCCKVPKFILPARVNQHVMIIRPDSNSNLTHYLLCLLCYSDNKSKLLGISQSGSTREAITKSEVEDFKILLPMDKVLKDFDERLCSIIELIEIKILQTEKLRYLSKLYLSKLATAKEVG